MSDLAVEMKRVVSSIVLCDTIARIRSGRLKTSEKNVLGRGPGLWCMTAPTVYAVQMVPGPFLWLGAEVKLSFQRRDCSLEVDLEA